MKSTYTITEYLEMEQSGSEKHEYYKGEIFAMSGASVTHNKITDVLDGELYLQLKGKACTAYRYDLRVLEIYLYDYFSSTNYLLCYSRWIVFK